MDNLFWALEFISSALVIVTLYLIGRSYKWWIAYAANSILFAGVAIYNETYWFALMGCCLCVTAIRNYYIAKKKEALNENSIS
jgi:hypothetical protein